MPVDAASQVLGPATPVWCTDGRVGRLADVVVDPASSRVTDLVVEPMERFRPLRLVPLWMIQRTDRGPKISLDEPHFARLQRVLESDFIRMDVPDSLSADGWRVTFATCLSRPFFDAPDELVAAMSQTVPILDCSIRRGATVMGAKGNLLGQVAGFATQEDRIVAVVVRSGALGQSRDVVVPFDVIIGDPGDVVFLSISIDEFRHLPETDIVPRGSELRDFFHRRHNAATGRIGLALTKLRGMLASRRPGR